MNVLVILIWLFHREWLTTLAPRFAPPASVDCPAEPDAPTLFLVVRQLLSSAGPSVPGEIIGRAS